MRRRRGRKGMGHIRLGREKGHQGDTFRCGRFGKANSKEIVVGNRMK